MLIHTPEPCYLDGSPMRPGDELEVSYPDIRPIPHRGLIYSVSQGPWGAYEIAIVHNTKQGGVRVVSWAEFAQGQPVRLRRRPVSAEHARLILDRATRLLYHPYDLWRANCEHFTDFCYNGLRGESSTLQAGVWMSLGVVGLIALSDRP